MNNTYNGTSQFMADHFKATDTIQVNCRWLQAELMDKDKATRTLNHSTTNERRLQDKVESLEQSLAVLKYRLSIANEQNGYVLNIGV